MNAAQIYDAITERGAVVSLREGAVVIKPREVLDDALRAEIRANKTALVELLSHGDRYADSSSAPQTPLEALIQTVDELWQYAPSTKPTVTVARSPDDEMGRRIEATFNQAFTPAEIEEYNAAVAALDSGQDPQENHDHTRLHR